MTLVTRMSRLLRADVNAVLDRIEEPAALLRQAVRDMEEALARDEQRARRLESEQQGQTRRLTDLERTLRETDEQLDLCFRSDREDLARTLIRRRLETEQSQRLTTDRLEGLSRTLTELRNRIVENRARLAEVRRRAELVTEEPGEDADDVWTTASVSVRDADVEVAFLREKGRRAGS
ncbi:PspA/IM30 family protein [Thiocapsa marina]|uniref:PspA/IM30 family protein n=1 Tax=Thiocapsa marina 5811 TaxID=768671 RepID=F9U958_9GAMM|nr:PspA/IM30 family protein [Thiocapsa marina]EGV19316.1 PspA/IM30 family protein [Thiocapsa marina 5811]